MKMLLISLFSVSSFAFAGDIHMQNGETAKVVVEGCKSSEYGVVFTTERFDSHGIVAKCLPKICSYYGTFFGTTITLQPENRELARTKSKAETRALLEAFVKNGICAETHLIPPSM